MQRHAMSGSKTEPDLHHCQSNTKNRRALADATIVGVRPRKANINHRHKGGLITQLRWYFVRPTTTQILHLYEKVLRRSPYPASRAQAASLEMTDYAGRVGWRQRAFVGAHMAIAYPPQHKQIDSSTLNIEGRCDMAGDHCCLWWVGYFKSEAGQGSMTPTHPTQILHLYEKVLRRSPYPASRAQAASLEMTDFLCQLHYPV